jgi:hypothetical protein
MFGKSILIKGTIDGKNLFFKIKMLIRNWF